MRTRRRSTRTGTKEYPEALPHLVFMAFLQRMVNGGGTVEREFAAGRKAVDLVVLYGPDRFVVELKRIRPKDGLDAMKDAAAQISQYLDALGEREGWLLFFDQRPGRTWDERLWSEVRAQDGKTIRLQGA